jgi:hypothetical protein
MRAGKRFFARFRNFATGRRSDKRLRKEMEQHLAMQTHENIRAGMSLVEARRQARLKLGGVEAIREEFHAEGALPLLENQRICSAIYATLCVSWVNRLDLQFQRQ